MFRKLLLAVATLIATMNFAFAQVDVNKADQAALDGVKGIGPTKSKAILDERKKGGEFKDWADFEKRVKGIGDKSAQKLSDAGLMVNGQPRSKTTAAAKDDNKRKAGGKESKSGAAQDASPVAARGAGDVKASDAKGAKKDAKKDTTKEAKKDEPKK